MSENNTKTQLEKVEKINMIFKKYILIPFGVTVGIFLIVSIIQGFSVPEKLAKKSVLTQIQVDKENLELCKILVEHARNKITDVLAGIPPKDYSGPQDMAKWQKRIESGCNFSESSSENSFIIPVAHAQLNFDVENVEIKKNVEIVSKVLDLDKLAIAVSIAETSGCTKGSGISKNNCFGIMKWVNGKRYLKSYKTKEESFEDFKRIWTNPKGWYKGRFPNEFLADKWTGKNNAAIWLDHVTNSYYN